MYVLDSTVLIVLAILLAVCFIVIFVMGAAMIFMIRYSLSLILFVNINMYTICVYVILFVWYKLSGNSK